MRGETFCAACGRHVSPRQTRHGPSDTRCGPVAGSERVTGLVEPTGVPGVVFSMFLSALMLLDDEDLSPQILTADDDNEDRHHREKCWTLLPRVE